VNVFAGFSFADMPDTGVSFTAVTLGEPRYALAELQELSEWATTNRVSGNVREEPLESVITRIKSMGLGTLHEQGPHAQADVGGSPLPGNSPHACDFAKPIILAEPSDNIGGGAPGDGADLLRALVDAGIENAAVAINDPKAVAALADAGPGELRS